MEATPFSEASERHWCLEKNLLVQISQVLLMHKPLDDNESSAGQQVMDCALQL